MPDPAVPVDDEMLDILARSEGARAEPATVVFAERPTMVLPGNNGFGTLLTLGTDEASRKRAIEMQVSSRESFAANRARKTAEARERAAETMAESLASVERSNASPAGSILTMAEKVTRMMLKALLNGGEMFVPTSAKEAADIAKIASSIAQAQRTGRAADRIIDATVSDLAPTAEAVQRIMELAAAAKARSAG